MCTWQYTNVKIHKPFNLQIYTYIERKINPQRNIQINTVVDLGNNKIWGHNNLDWFICRQSEKYSLIFHKKKTEN